ncbi:MAG: PEP-CTERM sorting domain-containing protein [Pirellulales bacterium]
MSWKNLASVAVCALLASPAWAVPSLQITNMGLNGNGDWVWNVSVTPETAFFIDNPPNGVGGSIAVELGLTASGGAGLLVGSPSTTTANIENSNPGNVIFSWETLTDVQDPLPPDAPNMKPVGLQDSVANDQIFAALGSTYFTSGGAKHIITVTTDGPSTAALTSSLALHDSSLIAQNDPSTTDDTYDFPAGGSATRTAFPGDADLSGTTNFNDYQSLENNFGQPGIWTTGDFDGNGITNFNDYQVIENNFGQSGGSNTPLNSVPSGAGAGGSAAVPEPASIALGGLALLAGLGLVRRK